MELEKIIDDLTIERWRFLFLDNNIVLDAYYLLQKESKRHRNFQVIKKYDSLSKRYSNIEEIEVPFSEEIKQEALNKFVSKIKVIRRSERKKL